MKQNTDISGWLKKGGVVKRGKTTRAVGCDLHYSLDHGRLKPPTKRTAIPSHMNKEEKPYWERN